MSKLTVRADQLFALEMKFDGSGYYGSAPDNKDFNVSVIEMQCDEDHKWERMLGKMTAELARRRDPRPKCCLCGDGVDGEALVKSGRTPLCPACFTTVKSGEQVPPPGITHVVWYNR